MSQSHAKQIEQQGAAGCMPTAFLEAFESTTSCNLMDLFNHRASISSSSIRNEQSNTATTHHSFQLQHQVPPQSDHQQQQGPVPPKREQPG